MNLNSAADRTESGREGDTVKESISKDDNLQPIAQANGVMSHTE